MRHLRRYVVTSVLAGGVLSCQRARLGEDVRRDVSALSDLSLPQDARMIRRTEIEQHGRTARASWEFESGLSWEAYGLSGNWYTRLNFTAARVPQGPWSSRCSCRAMCITC